MDLSPSGRRSAQSVGRRLTRAERSSPCQFAIPCAKGCSRQLSVNPKRQGRIYSPANDPRLSARCLPGLCGKEPHFIAKSFSKCTMEGDSLTAATQLLQDPVLGDF
jgi:hypothetical protein